MTLRQHQEQQRQEIVLKQRTEEPETRESRNSMGLMTCILLETPQGVIGACSKSASRMIQDALLCVQN